MRYFYTLIIYCLVNCGISYAPLFATYLQEETSPKLTGKHLNKNAQRYFKKMNFPVEGDEISKIYTTPTHNPPQLQNEVVLKKIIPNQDGRIKVENTELWPYSPHGRLEIEFPYEKGHASGVLIAPNIVKTAAHAIYDPKYGGWVTNVTFAPGQDGESYKPFGQANALSVLCFESWENNPVHNTEHDIAFVVLDQPIGFRAGFYGILSAPDDIIQNFIATVVGYPGDKGGVEMYKMSHALQEVYPETLTYFHDTFRGQSGSSICGEWQDSLKTIGVHSSGLEFTANYGSRISKWKLKGIIKVVENFSLKDEIVPGISVNPHQGLLKHSKQQKKLKNIQPFDLLKDCTNHQKKPQSKPRRKRNNLLPEGWHSKIRHSDGKIMYSRLFPGKWVSVAESKFTQGYYVMNKDSFGTVDYLRQGNGQIRLFSSALEAINTANKLYYWNPTGNQ